MCVCPFLVSLVQLVPLQYIPCFLLSMCVCPLPISVSNATMGPWVLLPTLSVCVSQVELVLLQWVPWFLRMKCPEEWGELTPHHSPSNPQTKTCSSPHPTTTPAPLTYPQSLTSLQASLSQLSQPLPHPPSNPTLQSYHNYNPNPQPNIHLNPNRYPQPLNLHPNLHPNLPSIPHAQPNGHLPYMGFQSPPEPDPAVTWRGGGEERRGSDTHPPSSTTLGSPPPQPPTSPDPDPSSSGSSCVEDGAGASVVGTCHAQAGVLQAGEAEAMAEGRGTQ